MDTEFQLLATVDWAVTRVATVRKPSVVSIQIVNDISE